MAKICVEAEKTINYRRLYNNIDVMNPDINADDESLDLQRFIHFKLHGIKEDTQAQPNLLDS